MSSTQPIAAEEKGPHTLDIASCPGSAAQAGDDLYQRLQLSSDLVITLDEAPLEQVVALLPAELAAAMPGLVERAAESGGTVVLDSDGTGFLHLPANDTDDDGRFAFLAQMAEEDRILPGNVIQGEVSMKFMYSYRVSPDQVRVWERLAEHNVSAAILSGRKEGDLRSMYAAALETVPEFSLLPSKGRAQVSAHGTHLVQQLEERLEQDALRGVARRMAGIISDQIDHGKDTELGGLDPLDLEEGKQFEQLAGYRVSIQEVANKIVLIRLHHRYRACELAHAAGADVSGVESPRDVDGVALSAWLKSEAGREVLTQLERENDLIQEAWGGTYGELDVSTRDHVGYKSLSQDMAPVITYADVLRPLPQVLAYAGDHFVEGGNDFDVMQALQEIDPDALSIAVGEDTSGRAEWMVGGNQFDLFLAQYVLARQLEERKSDLSSGPPARGTEESSPVTRALDGLTLVPSATIDWLRALDPGDRETVTYQTGKQVPAAEFFQDPFVTLADGSALSQRDFLVEYAQLLNKVNQRAAVLMQSSYGLERMIEHRENREQRHDQLAIPHEVNESHATRAAFINQEIRRRIVSLARGDGDSRGITEMAEDLAVMELSQQGREEDAVRGLELMQDEARVHAEIMSAALSSSAEITDPRAQNRVEQMFLSALAAKTEKLGHVPELYLLNDVDDNMGEIAYNDVKPSDAIDKLLDNVLHPAVPGLPIGPRVPLIHMLRNGSPYAQEAQALYRATGANIANHMFEDARVASQYAAQNNIHFSLLTTNLEACAIGVCETFEPGFQEVPVQAVSLSSTDGLDKTRVIADELLKHPDGLFLMTDDSNGALRRALSNNAILPGLAYELPIEHVVFFGARVPGQGEEAVQDFPLQIALEQKRVPFAVNSREEVSDGKVNAYQGTTRLMQLYVAFKREFGSQQTVLDA